MSEYFFTGADGKKYTCRLLIYQDGLEQVYSFRTDFDDDNLNIVKGTSGWEYHSGRELYLDRWVAELGEQVDSGKFR